MFFEIADMTEKRKGAVHERAKEDKRQIQGVCCPAPAGT